MQAVKSVSEANEETRAKVKIWEYVFGFAPMAVVKCAIELGIADALESNGGSMMLSELSSRVGCSSSILRRIMRYLVHRGFFKKQKLTGQESSFCYVQTALSRLLLKDGANSLAAFILMESSPVMIDPWHKLSVRSSTSGAPAPFEAAHGEDIWVYTKEDATHNKLFNDGVASHTRPAIAMIVDQYPEVFEGIKSVVDVGGGDGMALRTLVKICPQIRGINFDLPHVVAIAPQCDGVEHVGGSMFELVPKADAAFLKWVMHNWGDDECIAILKKCREAIPKDNGKVIIAEAVINEGEEDEFTDVRLALDMVMLAHTDTGKERSIKEWEYVITGAGFATFTVKHTPDVISVIEAYP